MALGHFQAHAVDRSGNVIAGGVVTVVNEASGALAVLKADFAGVAGKPNGAGFVTDANGYFDFYTIGGWYRITVVKGLLSCEWRYQPVGTLQAYDLDVMLNNRRAQVRAATTGNITISTALNNGDTLDGVTLATNDLVLVKNQTTTSENGVYVVGVTPARAADFDEYNDHVGAMIGVREGDANADTLWVSSANVGGTLGTTPILFTKISVGTITIGDVATVGPDDPATVMNVGTAQDVVLDFEIPQGPPGGPGDPGEPGERGADGTDPGFLYTFSTATDDENPGDGFLRASHATLTSATSLYISKTTRGGSNIAAQLLAMDDSTNPVKGTITLTDTVTEAQVVYTLGVVTDATDYVKVAVSAGAGATAIDNGHAISVQPTRDGNAGQDGTGIGDVTAASNFGTDEEILVADGTGKGVKTGGITIAALTSSILATIRDGVSSSFDTLAKIAAFLSTAVQSTSEFGTDGRLLRSDGTGRGVQASDIAVDDLNNVSGVGTLTAGAVIEARHTSPQFRLHETDGATDEKDWCAIVNSAILRHSLMNDASDTAVDYMVVTRSEMTILSVNFPIGLQSDGDPVVTTTAAQTLTNKTLTSPVVNDPTGIVKADVGLGNVPNFAEVTTAQWRNNTAERLLSTDQVWAAGEEVAIAYAASVAPDMSTFINAVITMTGNLTLANPTNAKPGQTGVMRLVHSGAGRTVSYGTNWKFAGGSPPSASTASGAEDLLYYHVISSTRIAAALSKGVP